ncbi:GTP pyrophosphokinase [Corynebacterium stationis]|uniref:GTP pyrophosphokinase n=1 Tax=Corynebacterium stationis TaxID=1705 RepID=A0AB36CML2_9CORY|nr:GTP pyrophosphokinase [Corynebacterium stationis]NME89572.1 GTP pyrophosphokinase [Corynebacterium stationis]
MNSQEEELFLKKGPPFSKNRVTKLGSAWRDGVAEKAPEIDDFLTFNAVLTEELLRIGNDTINSIILPMSESGDAQVVPESSLYNLAGRVKRSESLLQKMRRMETTPILNVQDVAGIRLDYDMTLTQQTGLADTFSQAFKFAGAKRVDTKDYRQESHSGYRAVHLHIYSKAGRAEMQIRTALQSKWANLYEAATDVYGTDIKYLHEGAQIPPGATDQVQELHYLSDLVQQIEDLADVNGLQKNSELIRLQHKAYGILDRIHTRLRSFLREQSQLER